MRSDVIDMKAVTLETIVPRSRCVRLAQQVQRVSRSKRSQLWQHVWCKVLLRPTEMTCLLKCVAWGLLYECDRYWVTPSIHELQRVVISLQNNFIMTTRYGMVTMTQFLSYRVLGSANVMRSQTEQSRCVIIAAKLRSNTIPHEVMVQFIPYQATMAHRVFYTITLRNFVVNMSWLINTRSQLSLDSKLSVYKTILRPIWT